MGLQAASISCALSPNAEEEQKIKRIPKKKHITVFICTSSFVITRDPSPAHLHPKLKRRGDEG